MALQAIGLVAGILGIISFGENNLPSGPTGATVRIRAGHEFESDQNFGGQISAIDGYDTFNKLIGTTNGGGVGDNSFTDFELDQSNTDGQVQYATIRNDNDATCIVYATLSNIDNNLPPGAWTGDIGASCGQTWYYGNTSVGTDSSGNTIYPRCTWLDSDHSNSIVSSAMKIDFLAYGQHVNDTLNGGYACSATIYQDSNGQIDGVPSGPDQTTSKRTPKTTHNLPRKSWMENQLIVSKVEGQSAKELCEHPMSWGSDFVGADGYFCDMSTHELSPLCSTHNVPGCVTVDGAKSVIKRTARNTTTTQWENKIHRSYAGISHYFDSNLVV